MEELPEFQLDLQSYDLTNLLFLGAGSYGKVYKAKYLKTNSDVAIKQINMERIKKQGIAESLNQQIKLMQELKGENVVQLLDYHVGDNFTYMVLELCETDLRKKMQKQSKKFTEQSCVHIFGEIIKGFRILVERSCIHRDIKPENILIKNDIYKLADFGFACKADLYGKEKIQDICGTPIYMAPQLLRNQPYTAKCDIWSLGLMLYELIYGYAPWPMKCPSNYLQCIKKRPLAFPFGVKIGKQTKDFIKRALCEDQQKRMGWQQLFKHPLIADKITGEVSLFKPVESKIRRILSGVQREAERKFIDQIDIFKKYEHLNVLSFNDFKSLISDLNPTVTTNEVNMLFEACDQNSNGQIDRQEFTTMFCTVDYRSNPEFEKQIDQLIGIVTARKLEVDELFLKSDFNKTNALDTKQFYAFIKQIAPKYSDKLIYQLYKKFDRDNNGLISKKQVLKLFAKGLVSQKNYVGIWYERAQRNLKTLRIYLSEMQLHFSDVMKMSDLNLDHHIDKTEFLKLVDRVKFKITEEQIDEIFKLIDTNQSGKISYSELQEFMKS